MQIVENRVTCKYINEQIKKVLEKKYKQVATNRINKTINKKNLKKIYNKYAK